MKNLRLNSHIFRLLLSSLFGATLKRTMIVTVVALGVAVGFLSAPMTASKALAQNAPAGPCPNQAAIQAWLNGHLPQTVNLGQGFKLKVKTATILGCDGDHIFIRYKSTLRKYVGGQKVFSSSGTIRVRSQMISSTSTPPTVTITNNEVLGLNIKNVPNWIDNTVIKDALNHTSLKEMVITL